MSNKRERRKRERSRRAKAGRPASNAPDPQAERKLLDAAATEAEQTASRYFRRGDLSESVVELARETCQLALRVIQRSPLYGRHECRPGCALCCHTAVTVAPSEALAIAAYLREHCCEHELARIRERLEHNAALAAGMTRNEYIARLIPCALLTDDGNCRAHPVRPMACAGFCSMSRAECEAEFNRVPNREPVPTDRFATAVGLVVSHTLMDACGRAGCDGQFYELHHALGRVLDTSDAVERWARGDDVFSACLR